MRNNGLMIGNALESGLRAYSTMQGIDANKQAMGLRDEQMRMQREQHAAQMDGAQQEKLINNARMRQLEQQDQERAMQLFAKRLYAIDAGGDASPDEIEQYMQLTGGGRLTDPKYIASPEVGSALEMYPRILKGEIDKNSPEAIQAYNTLINVQRGATDGRKVSINKVVPSRDGQGVHFGLNVVNVDGTVNPNGVLTDNRSADPNDPVSSISFDELNNAYGAIANLRSVVTNPKIRQALYREYGLAGESVSPKDQSVIDANKARANYYNSKATAERGDSSGQGGKLPAKAQMVNFYKSLGYGDEDSIAMANESASSPEKFVTSYSKMLLETSRDANGETSMTPDQAFEKSMQVYRDNFQRKPAKSAPAERPKADRAAAPALLSKPSGSANSASDENSKIKQILAANPGKSPEWAAAYLKHISSQSPQ